MARIVRFTSKAYFADIVLLSCTVIWGLNFSVTKYVLKHDFTPLAFIAPRFALSTAIFTGLAFSRERTLMVDVRDFRILVGVGGFMIALNQLTFIYAIDFTTASTVSLLFGTMPIWAALMSRYGGIRHWLGLGLSLTGVSLVILGAGGALSGSLGGLLLALVPPATFAAYSIMLQPLVRRYSSLRVNALVSLAGCVPLLIAAGPQGVREHWSGINGLGWGGFAFSTVFAYALTNVIWFHLVSHVGTARASIYVNLQPFLGAVFGVVLLAEHLTAVQAIGGIAIAASIVFVRWRRPLAAPVE